MAINSKIMPCKYACPCKDCQERTGTCHGSCERYNEYRIKERDYRREQYIKDTTGRVYWKRKKYE